MKKLSRKSWQEQSLARKLFKTTAAFTAVLGAFASQAASLDYFGQPPTTDPSAYTNQPLTRARSAGEHLHAGRKQQGIV